MHKRINMMGIGKRMPYMVRDGVFDDIEQNVLSATGCKKKTSRRLCAISMSLAIAASLTMIVMFSWHRHPVLIDSFAEVQLAFESLDNADQNFLAEIYNEDTFMNINY